MLLVNLQPKVENLILKRTLKAKLLPKKELLLKIRMLLKILLLITLMFNQHQVITFLRKTTINKEESLLMEKWVEKIKNKVVQKTKQ